MHSRLESRILKVEKALMPSRKPLAVLFINPDGTYPEAPTDADLVVRFAVPRPIIAFGGC